MDIVAQFLTARAEKRAEDAIALIHPNLTLGSVWGYRTGGAESAEFLRDEQYFHNRNHVEGPTKITQLDETTFQRTYYYNKNVLDFSDAFGERWFPAKFREVYFVKDGKINFVSCLRQPSSIFDFWAIKRL